MIKHVILADDDEDDCYIFTHVMSQLDKKVKITCVNNCYDLLDHMKKKGHPDVIFLDLNMPGMHGMECLRELKAHDKLQNLPVVVYSTSTNPKDMKDALQEGASGYITKSGSIVNLKEQLRKVFESESL